MGSLTLELPPQKTQTAFNLRRWAELLADPMLAKIEGRVETDRYGHIIMSPPPAPNHGSYQFEIGQLRCSPRAIPQLRCARNWLSIWMPAPKRFRSVIPPV